MNPTYSDSDNLFRSDGYRDELVSFVFQLNTQHTHCCHNVLLLVSIDWCAVLIDTKIHYIPVPPHQPMYNQFWTPQITNLHPIHQGINSPKSFLTPSDTNLHLIHQDNNSLKTTTFTGDGQSTVVLGIENGDGALDEGSTQWALLQVLATPDAAGPKMRVLAPH